MKYILTICLVVMHLTSQAQKVEIIQGMQFNTFFEHGEDLRFINDYDSGSGYAMKLAYEGPIPDFFSWRLTLGYESYAGNIRVSDGGNGGGFTVNAYTKKSILSFGVYPGNFKFWNRLHMNLGFEFTTTLSNTVEGTKSSFVLATATTTVEDLQEVYPNFNSAFHFGLGYRLAYDFNLSESLTLSPQYGLYYGLTSEFSTFPRQTRSRRHYISVGISKQL